MTFAILLAGMMNKQAITMHFTGSIQNEILSRRGALISCKTNPIFESTCMYRQDKVLSEFSSFYISFLFSFFFYRKTFRKETKRAINFTLIKHLIFLPIFFSLLLLVFLKLCSDLSGKGIKRGDMFVNFFFLKKTFLYSNVSKLFRIIFFFEKLYKINSI